MKFLKTLLLLIILTSFTTYSQSESFKKGWSNGYKEGFCYQKVGCVTPFVPVFPLPDIGENTYTGGYNKGFLKGKSDNSSNSSNDNTFKKYRPVNSNYGTQIRDYARRSNELESERRLQTQSTYKNYVEKGFRTFEIKDYEYCIYYYDLSKDLGWYNANFEHIVAVSYFELWKQTKKPKYKSQVKKMLKLSEKHGSKQAKVDLKKLKGLINKYENTIADNVYDGDIFISTQSEIDTFTYTKITGNLRVNQMSSTDKITNLKGLISLTSVDKNLTITGINSITSLKGLDNLISVNGSLNIMSNSSITSLDGLKNVTSVGSLFIWGNAKLNALNGVENITSINEDLKIGYNRSLVSFCAIRSLIINKQVVESKYTTTKNAYNPTYSEIQINGNGGCKQ